MQYLQKILIGLTGIAGALAITVDVTPHQQFSSSIGVLGCKVNSNRAAFFPSPPGCNEVCIRVTHASGRSLTLLHVDTSGGYHDISYDAFNYLASGNFLSTGGPAIESGPIPMDYNYVPMIDPACQDLLTDLESPGKLGFSAPNPSFAINCMVNAPDSWVANNHALYNIYNTQCTYGIDELCHLTPSMIAQGLNQPACPNILGTSTTLTTDPVYNYAYGTTNEVQAL